LRDGDNLGKLALEVGTPILLEPDELPNEASLVTVSAVGAPAAKDQYLKPVHYVKAKVWGIVEEIKGADLSGQIESLPECDGANPRCREHLACIYRGRKSP